MGTVQGLKPALRDVAASADGALAGGWVCSGSPLVAEIMAGSGLDLILIDMEHAANDLASVLTQLQVLAAYPVTALVRVPVGDPVIIKQVLDLGAQNLIVPMVSTPAEADAAARAVQYPPAGVRGVGSSLARSARWDRVPNYLHRARRSVSLVVQIETHEGAENARAIARTPGVEGILIGPADLAASMGLLGAHDHVDVVSAVHQIIAEVKDAKKLVGVNAFNPAAAQQYAAAGADFVLVGADVLLLARGSEHLAEILAADPEPGTVNTPPDASAVWLPY